MTLVRHAPWTLMNALHRDLDALLRAPLAAPGKRPVALLPSVDVHEEAERYVVRADLPGVQPADIQVTAEQGVLSIRAERRANAAGNGHGERVAGVFARRFTLPPDVDAEAISARSVHGVLELSIPKQPKPQPRRIAVEAA